LPKARSRITNGVNILPGIDQRSTYVRRFRDVLRYTLTSSAARTPRPPPNYRSAAASPA
jgi:hypothetical protein